MSDSWKSVSFAELSRDGALSIGDGYRAKLEELGGSGPIFLRAGRLSAEGIDWKDPERFLDELVDRVSSKMGLAGDTMITTKGNSVGRTGFVRAGSPPFVYSPHLSYWRSTDHERLEPGFLRYWSRGMEFRQQLQAMAHGTDMAPYLSLSDQHRLTMTLPDIASQRAIASALGALDDKIESNRRAIDLIQALGRSTYATWRGAHPDTYETTFGEFAEVFGGATPRTTEPGFWGGHIAWATPTDVTALSAPYLFGTARMITEAGLASTSATLHPVGTIFMTSRATIGSFAVVQVPAATNQGFIVVRPRKPEHRWFLFEEMRARVPDMLDRANGSTFMELSRGNFKLMPLEVPDEAALAGLDAVLSPLNAKAAQLDRETWRLASLRDSLLPELLSGRIRAAAAGVGVGVGVAPSV